MTEEVIKKYVETKEQADVIKILLLNARCLIYVVL